VNRVTHKSNDQSGGIFTYAFTNLIEEIMKKIKKSLDLFCSAIDSVASVQADANIDPSISAREAGTQPSHVAFIRGQHALNEGERDIIALRREQKGEVVSQISRECVR
jgi:hypothetical protein